MKDVVKIYNWSIHNNKLRGFIAGHKNFEDGTYIETSEIMCKTHNNKIYNFRVSNDSNYEADSLYVNPVWIDLVQAGITKTSLLDIIDIDNIHSRSHTIHREILNIVGNRLKPNWLYIMLVGTSAIYAIFRNSHKGLIQTRIIPSDLNDEYSFIIKGLNRCEEILTYNAHAGEIGLYRHIGLSGILLENIGDNNILLISHSNKQMIMPKALTEFQI